MFKKIVFTIVLAQAVFILTAQPKENSPISRFGIGNYLPAYFAGPSGMGGFSAAYRDPAQMNFINPASFGSITSATFEGGFYLKRATLQADTAQTTFWGGNLQYLSLGFPMQSSINEMMERKKKKFRWGAGISLQPYTFVAYDILDSAPHAGIDTATVNNEYDGRGGTYKLQLANGWRYKAFSLGIKGGFLFGKITNQRAVSFDNLANSYNDLFLDEISLSGFVWNSGAQYDLKLSKNKKDADDENRTKHLVFGVYGNSSQGFRTNSSRLWQRTNSTYLDSDTIRYYQDSIQHGTLPSEFGVGIMYEDFNKLRIGADYSVTNWSGYTNEAKPEIFSNTWRVSVGGEYIPDYSSYNKFSKRLRYRLGGYYGLDPRSLDGEQLSQWGITAGVGLPIILPRQAASYVNFALEYGNFGTTVLNENFFKLTVGYTLTDNTWFFKRKFE